MTDAEFFALCEQARTGDYLEAVAALKALRDAGMDVMLENSHAEVGLPAYPVPADPVLKHRIVHRFNCVVHPDDLED